MAEQRTPNLTCLVRVVTQETYLLPVLVPAATENVEAEAIRRAKVHFEYDDRVDLIEPDKWLVYVLPPDMPDPPVNPDFDETST